MDSSGEEDPRKMVESIQTCQYTHVGTDDVFQVRPSPDQILPSFPPQSLESNSAPVT